MALVNFKQSTEAKILSAPIADGTFYVSTDTNKLFLDISNKRVEISANTNTTYTLTKSGNTITLNASDGNKYNITDANTTYGDATTVASGLMSAADKAKLDGIAAQANKVVVDASLSDSSTNPVQNKVIKAALDGKAPATHGHGMAQISGLNEALAGKAPTSHTHTTAQVSGLDTALAGKAPTNHTHHYAGSASVGGAANTAIKLQTPRQISLSEGIESAAQNFDGSSNIAIPVRKIKESYLDWGGYDIYGEVSPVDMAASSIHSANRFQFADPAGITIEYSQNGTSFQPYPVNNNIKTCLVSGITQSLSLGGAITPVTDTAKLRITLTANKMKVYTRLKKLLIEVSQNGTSEFKVDIETAKRGSDTNFTALKTTFLSGWSGWNSIFFDFPFGGGDNQTSNIGAIRLTFSQKKGSSQTNNATVMQIVALGSTYWQVPSTMARTGHLYEWDNNQNATFPGTITAKGFNGNAASASKVEWNGVQNKPSTFAPSAHNHDAANITSGVLNVDRVPSIPTTKLTGIINQANLPSYVDDVLEFANKAAFPTKGESGKIYVDQATNITYRWGGTAYVEISPSLALGTTSSTAFRGDYGNTAYQHAVAKGSAFAQGMYKITTNSAGHVTAAQVITKSDITALGIPAQDTNTWIAMKGASASAAGGAGYVPAPTTGQQNLFLRGDGTWAQGPVGPKGDKGATGERGPQGIQGIQGATGATPVITASATVGNTTGTPSVQVVKGGTTTNPTFAFNFTNLKGAQGPQGIQGIQGPKGDKGLTGDKGATGERGPQGATGAAATIKVGTVSTGNPGTNATVVNEGTANAAVFNFTIPRGATGATGPQGPAGAKGATGDTGPQGPAGARGATGERGPAGANGTSAAWHSGTLVTGTSTSAITVAVSGSKAGDMYLNTSTSNVYKATAANSWVYVCNIKGATGATGATGSAGPQGIQGPQGVQGPAGPAGAKGATGATGPAGPQGPQGPAGVGLAEIAVQSSQPTASNIKLWIKV